MFLCHIYIVSPNVIDQYVMFQYYEMSYGLNVEMHKQVRTTLIVCYYF